MTMEKKLFAEALDWTLTSNDASDAECRTFCDVNDIEAITDECYTEFNFNIDAIDDTGATLTITKSDSSESNATLSDIAQKTVKYYDGTLEWDNEGYGTKDNVLRISIYDGIDNAREWLEANGYEALEIEVHAKSHIVSQSDTAVTVRVDFEDVFFKPVFAEEDED